MRLPSLLSMLSGMPGADPRPQPTSMELLAAMARQGGNPLGQQQPQIPPMPQGPPQQDLSSNPFAFLAERMMQGAGGQQPEIAPYMLDNQRRTQAIMGTLPPGAQAPPAPDISPDMLENQRRSLLMGTMPPAEQPAPIDLQREDPEFWANRDPRHLAEPQRMLLDPRNAAAMERVTRRINGLPQPSGIDLTPREKFDRVNMRSSINPNTGEMRPATPWQPMVGGIGDGGAIARAEAEQRRIAANSLSNDLAMQQRRSTPFDTNPERMAANRNEALTPGMAALLKTLPTLRNILEGKRDAGAMDLANEAVMNRLTGGEWMRLQLQQRDERNAGVLPNELARRTVPLRSADEIARRTFDRQVRADKQRERAATPEGMAFENHMRDLADRYKSTTSHAQKRAIITQLAAARAAGRRFRMAGGPQMMAARQQAFNDNPEMAYKYAALAQQGQLGMAGIASDERQARAQMGNTRAIAALTAANNQERNRMMGDQITQQGATQAAEATLQHNLRFNQLKNHYMTPDGGAMSEAGAIETATKEIGPLRPTAASGPVGQFTTPQSPTAEGASPAIARRKLGDVAFDKLAQLGTDYGQIYEGPISSVGRGMYNLVAWAGGEPGYSEDSRMHQLAGSIAKMLSAGQIRDGQMEAVRTALSSTMPVLSQRIISGENPAGSAPVDDFLRSVFRGESLAGYTPQQLTKLANTDYQTWLNQAE